MAAAAAADDDSGHGCDADKAVRPPYSIDFAVEKLSSNEIRIWQTRRAAFVHRVLRVGNQAHWRREEDLGTIKSG